MTTPETSGRHQPRSRLRRARKQRGWSESDVAIRLYNLGIEHGVPERKLGVDARTVSGWELGKREPNETYTALLSLLYELPPSQLDLPALVLPVAEPRVGPDADAPTSATLYDPDEVKRRQFMERGLALFGAVTTAELNSDLPFRVLRALSRPGTLDHATVDYLGERAAEQWRTWSGHTLRSDVLLMFTQDELHRLTRLLEGSLANSVRDELTLVAGSLSMLAGVLHWDMRSYSQARSYLSNATTAAREVDNNTLGAVAHGWMSFAWSYSTDTRQAVSEALDSVRIGRSLPDVRPRVQRWLAAIEAEILATLGDTKACLEALSQAEASALADNAAAEDDYWTQYDPALFAGYKGACYLRLHRPRDAQQALLEALRLASADRKRVSSNLLTDLARAYALDGRLEEACEAANRALELNTLPKSVAKHQRLDAVVSDLSPWADSREVRLLVGRLAAMKGELQ